MLYRAVLELWEGVGEKLFNGLKMPCGSSLEVGQDVCISGWEYSIIFTGGERFRKGW